MRTKGSNSGATSCSLVRNAALDMQSYALRPSSDTSTASGRSAKAARTCAAKASVPALACGRPWPLPHATAACSPRDRPAPRPPLRPGRGRGAEPPATAPGAVAVGVLGLAFGGKVVVVVAVAVGAWSCHRAADILARKNVCGKKNSVSSCGFRVASPLHARAFGPARGVQIDVN